MIAAPPLDYPAAGFDCYAGLLTAEQNAKAVDGGAKFVIHYYGGSHSKDLTKASLLATTAAGLWCGAVFEGNGDAALAFTADYGERDAQDAIEQAQDAGQPGGSAIYFAVDFGPTYAEITTNILPYFKALAPLVRAAGYKVGAYACGTVLIELAEFGLIDYDWLAGAMGWPGSRGYSKAAMVQGAPPEDIYGLGFQVDRDTAYREAGLFQLS